MAKVADLLPELDRKVMAGLKDFQKATVARIDELYRAGQMRILVSDEVGLGKTLIARGAIVKLAQMRKEAGDDLVKIVYICSNAAIADQNLAKLRISQQISQESVGNSRLSMQHLTIFTQENDPRVLEGYIQLIPLTPETSFKVRASVGNADERALIFAILRRMPQLKAYVRKLSGILRHRAMSIWPAAKKKYDEHVRRCDANSKGKYLSYMLAALERELSSQDESGSSLLSELISICENKNPIKTNKLISRLRLVFARISLEKLEPDLVIMDEFQRFRYLLDSSPESETGMLTRKFFKSDSVRMLLLSATPYKMYSTLEEIDETAVDEHYGEFLKLMNFLNISGERNARFNNIWNNYSMQLKEFSRGANTLISAKNSAEAEMYNCVCRTERVFLPQHADMIDDSDVKNQIEVSDADIKSYVQFQKMLNSIGASYNVPLDYIKSAPYLMSFMRDYKLKKLLEDYFANNPQNLSKIRHSLFWIRRGLIESYAKIPENNARLARLMKLSFENKNSALLLWVPPCRPYYELGGVFRGMEGFSKTLVFSAWEMVPRMIASLVSYEAERRTVGKLVAQNREARYFSEAGKRYPPARLNFSVNQGKPAAMSLFCLLYPSLFLSRCYDPIDCLNRKLSLREIEREIKKRINEKLALLPAPDTGRVDRRWYFLAPLLMDNPGYAASWLDRSASNFSDSGTPADEYDEAPDEAAGKGQKSFVAHLEELRKLYGAMNFGSDLALGKKPDDLQDVLADMAIASPAICANRTLAHYAKEYSRFDATLPTRIARLFINRLNTVEATAAIELACGKKSEDAHWQNALTYAKHGNIQAMFDEYAHLLASGLDENENIAPTLASAMREGMDFRTTVYNADTFPAFAGRTDKTKQSWGDAVTGIRTHYAVAFIKGDGNSKDSNRKKAVRNAFNSPFRPFILASTSIAQEGLDFHNYCRRIVHWNLPSNPVDIEQREGRINRFKCLAIRQNIAKRYGDTRARDDVWADLFEEAARYESSPGCSELVPYWSVKPEPGMFKIERIIPMFPFSRDVVAYERLVKILSLYRLTLGHARQEELLDNIFKNCPEPEKLREIFINLSPYFRAGDKINRKPES